MRKIIISSHFDSEGYPRNFTAGDEFALVPQELLPPESEEGVYKLPGVGNGPVAIATERLGSYILFCYNMYLHPLAKWIEVNNIDVIELDADTFRNIVFNMRYDAIDLYYNPRALGWRMRDFAGEHKIPREIVPMLVAAK